jgi:RimJ/RimL family protein N-acetyltransferase
MSLAPILETERLRLRAFREDDLDALAAFWADEESARFAGGACGRDDAWRRMVMFIGHWTLRRFGFWALEEKASGTFAGYCGLFEPEGWPEPELGWSLLRTSRGRGLATEAARRARDYAYHDLGWTTLISFINPHNHPSIRVAERLGARREGPFELRGKMTDLWRHPGPADLSKTT